VVYRALERDPERRFQTAAEMRTAIEEALAASDMRVGHEDVARQFGEWLSTEEPLEEGSDDSLVDRRLRRRSLHGRTAMPTEDVPLPAAEASASREAESLAALDTTGTVPVRSRRPLAYGAIALGVVVGVLGVWKVAGGGAPATEPSASVAEPAAPPDPRAAVPAPSASIEPFSTPAVPSDSSTSTTTSPSPSTIRTRRPPTRIPKTAPSASHRKYDDTIQ
jgi:hypothetical protein